MAGSKGSKYFAKQPLDRQANLVALSYVMVKGFQQQKLKAYTVNINDGDRHFGDTGFRSLNSFRTT